jgi:outer membrane receptor protein involved in Fe transport
MFRAESYGRTAPTQNFDQQNTDFDEPRSTERDRFLSFDIEYKKRLGERFRLSARGFADAYDYRQDTFSSEPSTCPEPVTGPCRFLALGHSRWIGSEIQGTYDWTGNGRYETLVGVKALFRDVGGETDSIEANTGRIVHIDGKSDVTEFAGAAYIQQRATPVGFLHLNAGGRFDHDPRGGNRFSPRASAAFDVWQGGVLKVIYAEAFRAPNFFEYFFASPFQVQNLDLHAETVRSVESTIEQRLGRHKVLFGVYRSWWSDMISLESYNGSSDISRYENSGSIDNFGYNGRIEGALGDLRYGGSVTGAYTRRNTTDGKESLPVAPQLFGNLRASYAFPGFWPTVAVATTFVGKRPADRAIDGNFDPTPYASMSADIRVTLSQKVKWVPGLSYRFAGSYTTGNYAPYVAGPTSGYDAADPARGPAQLTPTVKLTVFGGLHYEFAP